MNIIQFFKQWKKGIEAITPLQMTKLNLMGATIMILGILIGLYTTWITGTRWLFIILIGSGFLITVSFIGMIQKYWVLKELYKHLKGGLNNE